MLKFHELIGFMSPSLSRQILEDTYTGNKEVYRAVMTAVAEARRVRTIYLERQSKAERHPVMISTLTRPSLETAAANLVKGWLLKKTDMLADFLNALSIPHQDGVVEDVPGSMEDSKLREAVENLVSKYPHEVVAVYLHSFNSMEGAQWPNLEALLQTDQRLQLTG
jgi:hypothetical protein